MVLEQIFPEVITTRETIEDVAREIVENEESKLNGLALSLKLKLRSGEKKFAGIIRTSENDTIHFLVKDNVPNHEKGRPEKQKYLSFGCGTRVIGH